MSPLYSYHDNPFFLFVWPAMLIAALLWFFARRKELIRNSGRFQYWGGITACVLLALFFANMSYQQYEDEAAQVEIWENGLYCAPWGFKPWAYFSDVQLNGPRILMPLPLLKNRGIQFTLDKRYIDKGGWSDYIKGRGAINCNVKYLDASPGKIFDEVYAAWLKGHDTIPEE